VCYSKDIVTRKLVYDPKLERVRMVAWTTASHGVVAPGARGHLRWIAVVLAIVASALAFDAAHASAEAETAPTAGSR